MSLADFLAKHGLEDFADVLRENDFTEVRDVVDLTDADLQEMGLTLGKRKRLLRELGTVRGGYSSPKAAAAQAPPRPRRPLDLSELAACPDGLALDAAVSLLQRLLGNIVESPDDERFRSLKTDNKRLSSDLFSVKGVAAFLTSVGFEERPGAFVLPAQEGVGSCKAALEMLDGMMAMRAMRDRERKRRLVVQEIRSEKRLEAMRQGRASQHAEAELLLNADVGTFDSVCGYLRRLLGNVAQQPGDPKFRRVKAAPDSKFRRECWDLSGAQEFLLDVAGWDVEQDAGIEVVRCSDAAAARAAEALRRLEELVERQQKVAEEQDRVVREKARRDMKDIMERAKKQRQGPAPKAHGGGGGGERIPMKEAIRRLCGSGDSETRREEDSAATSTISEISGLIECECLLRGHQVLARPWMQEAKRLSEHWSLNRNLAYLVQLREDWEGKVAAAKRETGKTLADIGHTGGAAAQPADSLDEMARRMLGR
eukprot:TRINITY_DN14800_c0_g1_i1.p1 TRINITY_DN14800_c0_g1~~TRINITY_DN14800_c0_g1_i1.p1  ORF type:complete len:483 (+),score=183.11 TRINITY_DN14800_c0_g1_i1:68-1516(+)